MEAIWYLTNQFLSNDCIIAKLREKNIFFTNTYLRQSSCCYSVTSTLSYYNCSFIFPQALWADYMLYVFIQMERFSEPSRISRLIGFIWLIWKCSCYMYMCTCTWKQSSGATCICVPVPENKVVGLHVYVYQYLKTK